jgi:hypothetical protein
MMIPGLLVGSLLFQVSLGDLIGGIDFSDPANIPFLKYFQILQSIALFMVPPLIIGWLALFNPWKYLKLDEPVRIKPLLVLVVILAAILPALNLVTLLNEKLELPGFLSRLEQWMQQMENDAEGITIAFLNVNTFGGYLVNVLMIAVIPALGEEFFFRGTLQRMFHQWFRNPHVAIILVSVVFSAFHLQFYGFLTRFALGVIFGYLFLWSGNLWYPVIAHFINNFVPVTVAYILGDGFNFEDPSLFGSGPAVWITAIPATVLAGGAMIWFRRVGREARETVTSDHYPPGPPVSRGEKSVGVGVRCVCEIPDTTHNPELTTDNSAADNNDNNHNQ